MNSQFIIEREGYRSRRPTNALTVDVEDYFQVSAFEKNIKRADWEKQPSRIQGNVDRTLDLFEAHGKKATFFTLGWIAERFPELVRKISEAGHELASHGYQHIKAKLQTPDLFREDVSYTKNLLEDITGCPILGYRAPSFSIDSENLWALEVLEEAGYMYSSSVYPIKHDHYGMPDAPRFPFRLRAGGILEIPITTTAIFGSNYPAGGGGYFRLFPYILSRKAIHRVNSLDQQPAIFYFHPWEIDPEQPRIKGLGFKARYRHYVNLRLMEKRLNRLLEEFEWDRVDNIFRLNDHSGTH